jgi:hypothetical protein
MLEMILCYFETVTLTGAKLHSHESIVSDD